MANTYNYKINFATAYQETLFRQPVYRAIAREAIAPKLYDGQTLKRNYISRFFANEVGSDGTYTPQSWTSTGETLTVNQKPEVSTTIVEWQDMLDDLRTGDNEIPNQASATMFNYIDSRVLGAVTGAAGSSIDASAFGGTSGAGASLSVSNVQQLFSFAFRNLLLKNALQGNYSPVKKFSGVKAQDAGERMPIAIIDAATYSLLQLSLGSRWTPQGDRVVMNGYIDYLFNFNIFVSNNLRWTGRFDFGAGITNGSTVSIVTANGTLVFTFQTALDGTTAGAVIIGANASATATNFANLLNAPTLGVSGKSQPFTYANLNPEQSDVLRKISAATPASTYVDITVDGNSNLLVSTNDTVSAWTTGYQKAHLIFCTSQCIDLAILQEPSIRRRPVSGKLADDLVMSTLAGWNVFHEQAPRIVDAQVDVSGYTIQPAY